jgi:4-hydroxybenzoyl-CoA thioesterase
MSKTTIYSVHVQFGDCDPAGIVFFPNFSKWMDAASLHFFTQQGIPAWREIKEPAGFVGTPLVEINTRFHKPATYGETIEVHTSIAEWRSKVFLQQHRVMRGSDLLCEGTETRAFCVRDASGRLKAIPVPAFIRERCE